MTNPDYTAMLFIIDESGSMYGIANDMEGGIKNLIKEQQALPGKLTIDVAYFDDKFRYLVKLADASDVKVNILPQGLTAMYDAVVRASTEFGTSLDAMDEADRPGTVLVVIVTDGQENASVENVVEDVKTLITRQQDSFSWNYAFLGANQDAALAGGSIGIDRNSTLTYAANAAGVQAGTTALSNYTTTIRSGQKASF